MWKIIRFLKKRRITTNDLIDLWTFEKWKFSDFINTISVSLFFSHIRSCPPPLSQRDQVKKKDTMFTYTCQEHDFYLSKAWFLPVQSMISTCPEDDFYLFKAWFLPVQSIISTSSKHDFYLSKAWFLPVQSMISTCPKHDFYLSRA